MDVQRDRDVDKSIGSTISSKLINFSCEKKIKICVLILELANKAVC